MDSKLTLGQSAPQFTLQDQSGTEHTLSDYAGKWVVLYFYPKDDTPGCTTQACSVRDNLPRFHDINATVFGISADSVESHATFAEKYGLPFTLLADEDHAVCEAYGVWKPLKVLGKEVLEQLFGVKRWSFIIAPDGTVAKIYPDVEPEEHTEMILTDLQQLQANS